MNKPIDAFVLGVFYICMATMHAAGIVDGWFSAGMSLIGVEDPTWQLYCFLVVCAALVVLALRMLGGFLGWCALILLVLLLLHRIVPGLSSPAWWQGVAVAS